MFLTVFFAFRYFIFFLLFTASLALICFVSFFWNTFIRFPLSLSILFPVSVHCFLSPLYFILLFLLWLSFVLLNVFVSFYYPLVSFDIPCYVILFLLFVSLCSSLCCYLFALLCTPYQYTLFSFAPTLCFILSFPSLISGNTIPCPGQRALKRCLFRVTSSKYKVE